MVIVNQWKLKIFPVITHFYIHKYNQGIQRFPQTVCADSSVPCSCALGQDCWCTHWQWQWLKWPVSPVMFPLNTKPLSNWYGLHAWFWKPVEMVSLHLQSFPTPLGFRHHVALTHDINSFISPFIFCLHLNRLILHQLAFSWDSLMWNNALPLLNIHQRWY